MLEHIAQPTGEPRLRALYLQGFAGVGKSELLRALARGAAEAGWRVAWVDARLIRPSASVVGVEAGFASALRQESFDAATNELGSARVLLLLDAFEHLGDAWLWLAETLLPQVPPAWSLALAGRWRVPQRLRQDPALRSILSVVQVGHFTEDEAHRFLAMRGIPHEHRDGFYAQTGGHPLALAMASELIEDPAAFARRGLAASVGLVQGLVDAFRVQATSWLEHRALMTCALARRTSEALLRHVLGEEHAHQLFEWLRSRSFIEADAQGLFPHDLLRDALVADLEWRDRELRDQLFERVRGAVLRQIEGSLDWPVIVADAVHLLGHLDLWRSLVDPSGLEPGDLGPATLAEWPAIEAMVTRHEGAESVRWLCFWRERGAQVLALRSGHGEVTGVIGLLGEDQLAMREGEDDPGVAALGPYLARHRVPVDARIAYYRWWMGRDAHQQPSAELTRVLSHVVQLGFLTPRLAFVFAANRAPERWLSEHADPTEECAGIFTIAGRRFGIFAHDLRNKTMLQWYEEYFGQAVSGVPASTQLTPEEVLAATRRALPVLDRPDLLRNNPLVSAGIVTHPEGDDAVVRRERAEALSEVVRGECELLLRSPGDRDLYRVLYRTYFEGAAKQRAAASDLAMSYATYRRRLAEATRRLADRLWQRQGGPHQT